MQEVKSFFAGMKLGFGLHDKSLDDQINDYLKEHPNYIARDISVIVGPSYLEAYVIFDVRDERKPQNGKNNGR